MSVSYLVDTSVLILSLKAIGDIRQRLDRLPITYMSAITLGELSYGAEHSVNVEKSFIEVDSLIKVSTVLIADSETARIYGQIKHIQARKGQMLPDNDLWIAATALQHGLTLIARDNHFSWISELTLEQW